MKDMYDFFWFQVITNLEFGRNKNLLLFEDFIEGKFFLSVVSGIEIALSLVESLYQNLVEGEKPSV